MQRNVIPALETSGGDECGDEERQTGQRDEQTAVNPAIPGRRPVTARPTQHTRND